MNSLGQGIDLATLRKIYDRREKERLKIKARRHKGWIKTRYEFCRRRHIKKGFDPNKMIPYEEFREFFLDKKFQKLWSIFIKSGDVKFKPTVDRIDASKGYIRGNIQILTLQDNVLKDSPFPKSRARFHENQIMP